MSTTYKISALCPHCEEVTFLETMTASRYSLSRPNLTAILHTIICDQCGKRFGTAGSRLVRERVG